jgi:predicted ATP-dependent serine protease
MNGGGVRPGRVGRVSVRPAVLPPEEPPVGESSGKAGRPRVATGVPVLDDGRGGGGTPNRVDLVEGNPGSGKTTLALQCLREGARLGAAGIYVTLSWWRTTKQTSQSAQRGRDSRGRRSCLC